MSRVQNPNLEILELAVEQLGELVDELVFLGGCATGLLITDPAAPPIRITRDVDAIVQVMSLSDYHKLELRLRARGFVEDMSSDAPVCRWKGGDVILDIMPTDERILGFGNQWYEAASQNADTKILASGKSIRMVSAPYFLITKLEAFSGRGNGDYLMSHDIEDIIAVLDGRSVIFDEVLQAEALLKEELCARFTNLLGDNRFVDAIAGHMPADEVSQQRVSKIIVELRRLSLKGSFVSR